MAPQKYTFAQNPKLEVIPDAPPLLISQIHCLSMAGQSILFLDPEFITSFYCHCHHLREGYRHLPPLDYYKLLIISICY